MCRKCCGLDSEESKLNFIKNIENLGGKVVGKYITSGMQVKCFCKEEHECYPTPNNIQQGRGMCRKCANKDPEESRLNFIKTIEDLGGRVVGKYINSGTPVKCFCKEEHECYPSPNSIQQGKGMCRKCCGLDPEESKLNFIRLIEEILGGRVVGEYLDNHTSIKCFCKEEHECYPKPIHIQRGQGMCKRCSQSGGELFISYVLEKLNINFLVEVGNDLIKNKFRYDFYFEYNNKKFYIELDGEQHFEYLEFFHDSIEEFQEKRQRDLFKNYIAKLSGIKIIRISYKQIRSSIDEFFIYLKSLFDREEDIIADCELYNNWIFNDPNEETIKKYTN